jgi:hypothetical protein
LATELLTDTIRGMAVPEKSWLPSELVVCDSCGCVLKSILEAGIHAVSPGSLVSKGEDHRSLLMDQAEQAVERYLFPPLSAQEAMGYGRQLMEVFFAGLSNGEHMSFLAALNRCLQETYLRHGDLGSWQDILSEIRRGLHSYYPHQAGSNLTVSAWAQARVLIGWMQEHYQAGRLQAVENQAVLFNETGQSLFSNLELESLLELYLEVF